MIRVYPRELREINFREWSENDMLLTRIAPEAFTIQHRIEAHLFQPV